MSEAPLYLILAQLNSIMTGGLRLTLGFGLCWLLLVLLSLWRPQYLSLSRYFVGWWALAALVSAAAAGAVSLYLDYPNPFVKQGLWLSALCLAVLPLLIALHAGRQWEHRALRLMALLLLGPLLFAALFWSGWGVSFSRSDKVLFSTLIGLPMALALSYFPVVLAGQQQKWGPVFHGLWGLSILPCLALHYFWLYPILSETSPYVEFYPYVNLYDWFLFVFVILYLGNFYIEHWLKVTNTFLSLSWNYLILLCALLCLWFNTNIFDTLAL